MQLEFRSLLSRHGQPVPPILIMDLLQVDDGKVVQMDSCLPVFTPFNN